MKYSKLAIGISFAAILAGCGGGGSSPASSSPPPPGSNTPSPYEQATNKARKEFQARLDEAQAAADEWMVSNRLQQGVVVTDSGLQYRINTSTPHPDGPAYMDGQAVKVHYEGRLTDGTVFDSTYKRGRPENLVPDQLIEGWQEALKLMSPGDEWTLFIPPSLGYGKPGYGSDIPPNAVLIFDVELR